MFCNRNKLIWHGAYAMIQHSDLHFILWHKPCPFAFRFNKVLMAGLLSMVRYQFLITDHGFLQTHFLSWIIHKNFKGKNESFKLQTAYIIQGLVKFIILYLYFRVTYIAFTSHIKTAGRPPQMVSNDWHS